MPRKSLPERASLWAPPLLYMGLIFYLSSQSNPAPELTSLVWDKTLQVDRTGLDGQTVNILGVDLPKITVPLNPGKNITVISEVIAMNHLLRYYGENPAEQFNQRLMSRMRGTRDSRQYLVQDDE